MEDPVKNNAIFTDFSAETLVKVPAEIHFKKGYGNMFFNPAFVNFEIIAIHLLKSGEWIYGIYYGANYYGYLYHGEKLSREIQFDVVKDCLPQNRNDLQKMIKTFANKIEYHISKPDAYLLIGEYKGNKIIQKK